METITRVCLIGPESTGKSQIAAAVAEHDTRVVVVPEFAREYALQRGNDLSYDDVEPIARGAIEWMERASGPIVVLDTDLISTVVYSRHYYGRVPQWIEVEARRRRADLYLLMDTDVAWKPDPARDSGGDAREDLFDAFRAALDEFETHWQIVSGAWEERVRVARAAVVGFR